MIEKSKKKIWGYVWSSRADALIINAFVSAVKVIIITPESKTRKQVFCE